MDLVAQDAPPARVLVVDDNPINAELARAVLEADGLEVRTADAAGPALACIDTFAPTLVLLDIQMPQVDGLALLRLIRARPDAAAMRLVALTAFAMPGDEARFRAAGFDGYLSKPIDVGSFAASVRACMA